jgi:ADP-heptose:LPS heptosyltransferase
MGRVFGKLIPGDYLELLKKTGRMHFLEKIRHVLEEIASRIIKWTVKAILMFKLEDSESRLRKIGNIHGLEEVQCDLCGSDEKERVSVSKGFRTVKCSKCGLRFVTPRFNQKGRKLFYSSKYSLMGYSLFGTLNRLDSAINEHSVSSQILKLAKTYKKSGDLLEIGPFGEGFVRTAERSGFQGWRIKLNGWAYDSPIEGRGYRTKNGYFLVYTGKFDVVTCLDILDRIPDPLGELKGIHEILKDDGILLIRVPNFGSEIAEEKGISWHFNRPWEKIYQFDYSRLESLLDKSGFKIIDLKTELSDGVGSPGCIIIVGMKKIWRVRGNNPRILVIREGAAGDVLLTTPIVKELKKKLPGSYLLFMTKYPEILQNNPYVDELTGFEPRDGVDVVFNLMYELYPDIPIIEAYGKITQLSLRNPEIEFYPSPDEHEGMDRLLERLSIENTDGFAVIHPMAGNRMKSWHKANYQAVSDHIGSKKLTSVTVGSPMDCVELKGATNLIGRLSMGQSAALISRARLFVGLDSFPMHIANAFKVPSVVLFGSTDPKRILIDGRKVNIVRSSEYCLGCRHDTTPDRWKQNVGCRRERLYCMENISADCVMGKIDEALKT